MRCSAWSTRFITANGRSTSDHDQQMSFWLQTALCMVLSMDTRGFTPDDLSKLGVGFISMSKMVGMADRGGGGFPAGMNQFMGRFLVF